MLRRFWRLPNSFSRLAQRMGRRGWAALAESALDNWSGVGRSLGTLRQTRLHMTSPSPKTIRQLFGNLMVVSTVYMNASAIRPTSRATLNKAFIIRGEHAMKRLSFVLSLLLVPAPGFASGQPQDQRQQDQMKKDDNMEKGTMSHDTMPKDNMSKDAKSKKMKKDSMKNGMKHDGMKKPDVMKDDASKAKAQD